MAEDSFPPDLSVVIVNHNAAPLLAQCLDSLEHTKGGLSVEIFVVDNGSTDESVSVLQHRYPGVHTIINSDNLGFARANNQALTLCQGRYVLLLNNDTIVLEGALETMVEFMDRNLDAAGVGPQLLNADGTVQPSCMHFPSFMGSLKAFWRAQFKEQAQFIPHIAFESVRVDAVSGACLMLRRQTLQEVGLLDESYFMYAEETDWCYRAKEAGWGIAYLPQARVVHLKGQTAKLYWARSYAERRIGRLRFLLKFRGRVEAQLAFWSITATMCLRWLFFRTESDQYRQALNLYIEHARELFRDFTGKGNS